MRGDVAAAAEPDVLSPFDVVEDGPQPPQPWRRPVDPRVQAHRHPARMARRLGDELFEGVAQELAEGPARDQRPPDPLGDVGHEGIRNHQVGVSTHIHPIRQLVVVGIAVVAEPPVLDEQSARVRGRGIPACLLYTSDAADD